jgi:hypothetical protein
MAYDRKNLKSWGHAGADDAAFLRVDADPFDAAGDRSGEHSYAGAYTSNDAGLTNRLPFERTTRDPDERVAGVIDDSQPYDPLLPGGAPLTQGKGVGSGPPRYAPKTGALSKLTNAKDR